MKLRLKFALAIGAVLLVAVGAGLFGIYKLNQSTGVYADVIGIDYAHERLAAQVLVEFKTQVQEWKNTLLRGKDAKQLDRYWRAFQQKESDVAEAARRLHDMLPEGEARALIGEFRRAHATMGEGYRKGFEAFKASSFDAAAGDAAVKGMDRAPTDLLAKAGDRIAARSAAAVALAGESSRRATVVSLALMLAVLAIGTGAALLIARSIVRPMAEALAVARAVAAGDLTVDVKADGHDETAQLLQAMADMTKSLGQVVGQVRAGVDSVSTASAQIAAGNQDLSSRTEEQASSLQQTAASMEQLTATVRQSADNARQASQLAGSASQAAEKGGVVVGQVVATMEEITAASRKIADIISVIDGIAFQTNILALNAAVEAARAGEQGRGFAVVAGEVRNLAQRSAQAAREIKSLINDSVAKVESGGQLVNEAGLSMTEIVAQVKRVTDLIAEITSASLEQSSGISQVNEAVSQMDQATQQNAALVEESAAAAQSLREQADRLAQAVAVFRLAQDEARAEAQQAIARAHGQVKAQSGSRPAARAAVRAAPSRVAEPKARIEPKPAATLERPVAGRSGDDWLEF